MSGVNPGAAAPAPGGQMGNTTAMYEVRTYAQNKYISVFLRQRAFVLGANVAPLTPAQRAAGGPPNGLVVIALVEDSPADRAGIAVGDILTAVEGESITGVEQYQKLLNARAGGWTHLTFVRKGAEQTAHVQLNALPKTP
jgi:S1-C subfamily serine protease